MLRRCAPDGARVQLLGSGALLGEVMKAGDILARELSVAADVWSVTASASCTRRVRGRDRVGHGERDTIEPT